MKKFLVTIFILAVLGGAGFFFGWVQLTVPAGSYGIINSKTHGVDPQPVRAGEFRWVWYKLIPTNVQIAVFRLDPVRFPVDFNSSLPSGESYASFAGLSSGDFSWNLRGEISFRVNPQMLVSLADRNNLTDQETLDIYLQDTAQNIKVIIMRTLAAIDTDYLRLERLLSGSPDIEMEQEIKNRFPEILDFSFVITSARFPDFALYRQVRLLYEDFLERQREVIAAGFAGRAQAHVEAHLHFGELERYGELLTRFPVLLDFMVFGLDRRE
jgi:hypothetical protein